MLTILLLYDDARLLWQVSGSAGSVTVSADRVALCDSTLPQSLVQSSLRLGDVMKVVGVRASTLGIGRDVFVNGVVFGSGGGLRIHRGLLVSLRPHVRLRGETRCAPPHAIAEYLHAACASSTCAAFPAWCPAGRSC